MSKKSTIITSLASLLVLATVAGSCDACHWLRKCYEYHHGKGTSTQRVATRTTPKDKGGENPEGDPVPPPPTPTTQVPAGETPSGETPPGESPPGGGTPGTGTPGTGTGAEAGNAPSTSLAATAQPPAPVGDNFSRSKLPTEADYARLNSKIKTLQIISNQRHIMNLIRLAPSEHPKYIEENNLEPFLLNEKK